MEITYKIWKVKEVYEKVLKEVTCNLQKVLNKTVKSIKKVTKVLKSVRKSSRVENPVPETSQPSHNANKPAGCNKTRAQNKRRFQKRPEYQ